MTKDKRIKLFIGLSLIALMKVSFFTTQAHSRESLHRLPQRLAILSSVSHYPLSNFHPHSKISFKKSFQTQSIVTEEKGESKSHINSLKIEPIPISDATTYSVFTDCPSNFKPKFEAVGCFCEHQDHTTRHFLI